MKTRIQAWEHLDEEEITLEADKFGALELNTCGARRADVRTGVELNCRMSEDLESDRSFSLL